MDSKEYEKRPDMPLSEQRKCRLQELFSRTCPLQGQEEDQLLSLLGEFHDVFALEDGKRGETHWIEMNINAGEAAPVRQSPRRVPFAV